jgi:glycosyltransferase involved in cell wall biosynthesis
MISVVVPLFNKAATIERTVRSVLAQQGVPFELLVIDDGSTDGGAARLAAIDDTRLRVITQPNGGVSAARNRGAAEAAHDLVAFLDADDLWEPGHLENLHRLHQRHPDAASWACAYQLVGEDGTRRRVRMRPLPPQGDAGLLDDYFLDCIEFEHPVHVSGLMVDRRVLQRLGGFPAGVHLGEDILLLARLACFGPMAYSREATAVYFRPPVSAARSVAALRRPPKPDPVAAGLSQFDHDCPRLKAGARRYRGDWHRIRSVLFLEHGERLDCLAELRLAVAASRLRLRDLAMLALALLPASARRTALARWRQRRRRD